MAAHRSRLVEVVSDRTFAGEDGQGVRDAQQRVVHVYVDARKRLLGQHAIPVRSAYHPPTILRYETSSEAGLLVIEAAVDSDESA